MLSSPRIFSTAGQTLSSQAQPASPAMHTVSGQYRRDVAESVNLQKSMEPKGANTHFPCTSASHQWPSSFPVPLHDNRHIRRVQVMRHNLSNTTNFCGATVALLPLPLDPSASSPLASAVPPSPEPRPFFPSRQPLRGTWAGSARTVDGRSAPSARSTKRVSSQGIGNALLRCRHVSGLVRNSFSGCPNLQQVYLLFGSPSVLKQASLFYPSMSALPIIAKQNSPSVGLFPN